MVRNLSLALTILMLSAAGAWAETIDHTYIAGVASMPQSTMDAIGQQKWLFTHASVGGNMINGMTALHASNAGYYQLVVTNDDGTPPASTTAGRVYEYDRGNPGWSSKLSIFDTAVDAGWRSPKIDVAMDKLCYIDQGANATTYVSSMSALEANYPETVFVYATMPLMTGSGSDNILRNQYNNAVRKFCTTNDRLLFDIADIEAFDPDGNASTFNIGTTTYQNLYTGYTSDGGHLNATGAQRVAKGWYAVAAAIAVPEPGTVVLLLVGAAMLAGVHLVRRKSKAE